ncbi:MAG TPA: hypothetical protein DD757_14045 [Alcanivorax sp.]|jgi:hypothetical protein|nr:hypothetical protein [Pseudomonadota bacterium]NQY84940.1 hypothetical protein [Alcanivorax sp.]HAB10002.1 hypothetical protein [Alcanivorax sp.]HAD62680.1 hypothetical protein [Alcanivorax sp.]HAI23880.1 hypothetical protein [Alcanivorax sp.]|tara:strand:- start:3221 stop:3589 length:369 start_codon:yes stop_codon:yes gene_type:complete
MTAPRRDPGYEQRDVSPRLPLVAAVLVSCLLAVVLGLIGWAFALRGDAGPRATGFFELPLDQPGTPHLQAEPGPDLQRMREISERGLHQYGWVDQEAGVVHIPIERAMALYARRHGDGEARP